MSEREVVHFPGGYWCKIEAWRVHYNQKLPPFCTGMDDSVRICSEICGLPEHAARLKPVISDYD